MITMCTTPFNFQAQSLTDSKSCGSTPNSNLLAVSWNLFLSFTTVLQPCSDRKLQLQATWPELAPFILNPSLSLPLSVCLYLFFPVFLSLSLTHH